MPITKLWALKWKSANGRIRQMIGRKNIIRSLSNWKRVKKTMLNILNKFFSMSKTEEKCSIRFWISRYKSSNILPSPNSLLAFSCLVFVFFQGNIRVFCRVRPALESERDKTLCAFSFPDECSVEVKSNQGSMIQSCFSCNIEVLSTLSEILFFSPPLDQSAASKTKGEKSASFTYDKVFPPTSTQMDIYLELSQLVQVCLN